MTFAVADLRAHLLGRWQVQRTMLDRAPGSRGNFTGTVAFTSDSAPGSTPGSLRQSENGTAVWPTFTGPAFREYRLVPTGSPAAMQVLFDDGRPFHDLDLSQGTWTASHWCTPDTYQVRFSSPSPDRLDYEWDVTGPAKDLLLSTTLLRLR